MSKPKIVILIFASEKLVCTGAKTEREAYEVIYKLKRIIGEVNAMEHFFPQRRCRKEVQEQARHGRQKS